MNNLESYHKIKLDVVYATPERQLIILVEGNQGLSVREAIELSKILFLMPDIDLTRQKVGIFSKMVSLDALCNDGDRIEIYRPLRIEPMEARRQRVKRR